MGCGVPVGDPLRHPLQRPVVDGSSLSACPLGESGIKRLTWRQRFPKTPATHAIGRIPEDFRNYARLIPLRCMFLHVGRRDPPSAPSLRLENASNSLKHTVSSFYDLGKYALTLFSSSKMRFSFHKTRRPTAKNVHRRRFFETLRTMRLQRICMQDKLFRWRQREMDATRSRTSVH